MSYTLKSFIKDITPSLALTYRGLLGQRKKPMFSGHYRTWDAALAVSTGYDASEILDKVTAATLKVYRGEAAFERDSVLFDEIVYSWPLLAALLWIAVREKGVLRICDFGGALGTTYFQNRKFLQNVPEVQWCIVEQAGFVERGKEQLGSSQLRFHETVEGCFQDCQCDALLLSSVLPYLSSPYEMLQNLLSYHFRYVLLDRTPILEHAPDRLTVQYVPDTIYSASYPAWFFNETKLLNFFSADYTLVEQFNSFENWDLEDVSSQCKGYIFIRRRS